MRDPRHTYTLKKKSKLHQGNEILPLPDGRCALCRRTVTHKVGGPIHRRKTIPLNNSDVSRGRCLSCFPYNNGANIAVLMLQYANGKYSGQMRVQSCPPLIGRREGQGIFQYTNGDTFKGSFKNDKPCGFGTFYYSSGERYMGDVRAGKPHGRGIYNALDGIRYEGDFICGKREGKGILSEDGRIRYDGKWANDQESAPLYQQAFC
mmetsp:Transcript_28225/g.32479  ORF Transcript_28225/g.32479 Transcript_28225/m.32479 type:complete len:206 (+) Transcript_28225:177-794(+)|eukprot:CAMPEP_0194365554 /NCGR_PEP_ID=MMETSP0174-20130528/13621_1 /TAXON_ID=216777 /ORGANISM="Proboscia alata, Strain PI-D3" /LENGTH=205 /DNA_ID=CAMNT_0039140319 /DNA_START=171 /DNA_END=788 /DNA_ORIENTATION=+